MLCIIFSYIQMSCALFTKMDLVSVEKKTNKTLKRILENGGGGGCQSEISETCTDGFRNIIFAFLINATCDLRLAIFMMNLRPLIILTFPVSEKYGYNRRLSEKT